MFLLRPLSSSFARRNAASVVRPRLPTSGFTFRQTTAHAARFASTNSASSASSSFSSNPKVKSFMNSSLCRLLFCASASIFGAALVSPILYYSEAGPAIHPIHLDWDHTGHFASLDHSSLRRGYQVYKEVCAACHSLEFVAYRSLVNVTHTKDELKAIAAESEIEDGPDDEGNMFMRPRTLADYHPFPFPNEEASRAANNGAVPPDFSFISLAREDGTDYLYCLLNGYQDPPAGFDIRDGLHYNTYFPGGAIAMKNPIYDGVVEFDDGTPATASQIAKDVTNFLVWSAQPEFDERKLMGCKMIFVLSLATVGALWYKRYRWSILKTRKIFYKPPKYDS